MSFSYRTSGFGRISNANYGTHFVWHIEGGKGTKGKIVKFQS